MLYRSGQFEGCAIQANQNQQKLDIVRDMCISWSKMQMEIIYFGA